MSTALVVVETNNWWTGDKAEDLFSVGWTFMSTDWVFYLSTDPVDINVHPTAVL